MRKLTLVFSTVLLVLSVIGGVWAQPAANISAVTIDAPPDRAVLEGSEVSIAVSFNSGKSNPVTRVQVFLNGQFITERVFETPVPTGKCSFLWDTLRTPNGTYKLDVQILADDEYLGMASCSLEVANTRPDLTIPRVAVLGPTEGQIVSGVTNITVDASDDSGIEPFVSIYVNKSLRAMKNRGPYTYEWDTTREENGPASIEVTAVDQANNFARAEPVNVIVQNPEKQSSAAAVSVASTPAESGTATATPMAAAPAAEVESARTSTPAAEAPAEQFEVERPSTRAERSRPAPTVAMDPPAERSVPETRTAAAEVSEPVSTQSTAAPVEKMPEPRISMAKPTQSPTLIAKLVESKCVAPSAAPGCTLTMPCSADTAVDSNPKQETRVARAETCPIQDTCTVQDACPTQCPLEAGNSGDIYIVKNGDTILGIAKSLGVSGKAIVELNKLENPHKISIGQKLRLPSSARMVQIRPVFEEAGGSVIWNAAEREVRAVCSQTDVVLKPGSDQATVNSRKVKMDSPAMINSGRTMVAESFVTETLGLASGQ